MIAKDVRTFLKQFETTLTVLAREGRHPELKARFEDYHKLLGAWLDVAPPGASPPDRMRLLSILDRFGGPLEIDTYEIARAAMLSADTSTVVLVADQLIRGAFACLRREQPRLMEEYLNTLVFLYYQCIERDSLADAVGHRLDLGLHSLFMAMRALQSGVGEADGVTPSDAAALDVALRFTLALIHAAIRFEKIRHATFFVERLFEHRKHRHHRCPPSGPVTVRPEVIVDYVAVVLAGWALHILQSDVLKNADSAQTVLNAAISQVPAAPVLAAEWEVMRGAESQDAAIDRRLGIAHWDVRDLSHEYRAGVGEARWGGPDWVRMGLRVALLRTNEQFFGDELRLFSSRPRRFVWDAAMEREALQALAADALVGIPVGDRQRSVDSAMRVIAQRARGANAAYLRYVLESPLSDARISQFRADAERGFDSKRAWQSALRKVGLGSQVARSRPLPTRWETWVPREYLLDDNNWASGFGGHLGEAVARREAMALIHLIETSAGRRESLEVLATLPERLREARRTMLDAGFKPNVIILPCEERFADALFRMPLWKVEGRNEFGEASVGVWEQLHVLRFPYANPVSILLLDTEQLIAECRADDGSRVPRVWVEERPRNQEMEAKRDMARAAVNSADAPIPESNVIQVLACMEAVPSLGLMDTSAATAIDIRDSGGG